MLNFIQKMQAPRLMRYSLVLLIISCCSYFVLEHWRGFDLSENRSKSTQNINSSQNTNTRLQTISPTVNQHEEVGITEYSGGTRLRDSKSWKTYVNHKYGYSFHYPSSWWDMRLSSCIGPDTSNCIDEQIFSQTKDGMDDEYIAVILSSWDGYSPVDELRPGTRIGPSPDYFAVIKKGLYNGIYMLIQFTRKGVYVSNNDDIPEYQLIATFLNRNKTAVYEIIYAWPVHGTNAALSTQEANEQLVPFEQIISSFNLPT